MAPVVQQLGVDTLTAHDALGGKALEARAETSKAFAAGRGSIDPRDINMQGLFALFALIGAAFVLGAIWFFFWAKNGGFVWRKGDWEEYKSTVLRRKGVDGRTLSNATKSTRLGGGSVVGKGYSDSDGLTVTDTQGYTETATSFISEKEPDRKRKHRRNLKETTKQKLLRKRKEEKWEGEADDDMRAYRHEKPALVGGMNRTADGTYHGSDYDTSARPSHGPYDSPSGSDGYRQVQGYGQERSVSGFSFTAGSEDILSQATEEQHLNTSARRSRRRDGESRRRQDDVPSSSRQSSPRKRERRAPPGGYTEALDFSSAGSRSEYHYSNLEAEDESNTRSYHHPVPELTRGYRRDGRPRRNCRDSLSDSEAEDSRA